MLWILTQSIPPETKLETKDDASIVEDEATWPEIVLHPRHNSETNKDDSNPVKEEPGQRNNQGQQPRQWNRGNTTTNVRTTTRVEENPKDYEEPRELVDEVTRLSHDEAKNLFARYLEANPDFHV